MYIANQSDLEAFVNRAQSSSVLAIDTEFLREKTYYAKLCLIQMATDKEVVLIDPFGIKDLQVLGLLLENESITKLFHAASQDLEILYREVGVLAAPLFDTQIAATLLGHTQQIGYASLVHHECGVTLKKVDSYTDWSRRPLSASQLDYAADDVIYLPKMYHSMKAKLEEKGRLGWLEPEFADMSKPEKYVEDERLRYKRLKRVASLGARQLACAREVAAWREIEARRRDIPRKWVLTDEQIVETCKREARTIDNLMMVRGMSERLSTAQAREVVSLMTAALDSPPSAWPEPERYSRNERNVDVEIDLMMALVHMRARENGVAVPTLASHDDLAKIARGHREGIDLLRGWRRSLIGEELVELLEGRVQLSLCDGELQVVRL